MSEKLLEESELSQVLKDVQQYVSIKDQVNLLTKRQQSIKKHLQEIVLEYGETDGRGHVVLEINDPITGTEKLMQQRRVSKALDIDVAQKLLEEKDLIEECIEFIPTINEEAVMAAFYKGKLTEEDIDSMFPAKVSYAFIL